MSKLRQSSRKKMRKTYVNRYVEPPVPRVIPMSRKVEILGPVLADQSLSFGARDLYRMYVEDTVLDCIWFGMNDFGPNGEGEFYDDVAAFQELKDRGLVEHDEVHSRFRFVEP